MIELEKFTKDDFDRFISWIGSEEALIQFAGPLFQYPLSHAQLDNYVAQQKKQPFKVRLIETNEIIGHCELNLERDIPRLSRILIADKGLRNKGIGKSILKKMIDHLFTTTQHTEVDLSVFDWNYNAIACYEKIGFKARPDLNSTMMVSGKNWNAFNMTLSRDDFYANN